jgi:multicomponent Na+:H+ antiporter subunit D
MTLHPHYLLFASALLLALPLPPRGRQLLMLCVPGVVLWWIFQTQDGGDFTLIFAVIFTLVLWFSGLFSWGDHSVKLRRLEDAAAYAYAGSAIGVIVSNDFLSLFAYWEVMALASGLVILSANTAASQAAALRYVLMHLVGGVILLIGISAHIAAADSIALTAFHWRGDDPAHWLMLIGVLINAAAPPFSAWLSDAYPEASPTGMVVLSAFTTKTAVYALLILFPGVAVLMWLGLLMIGYGVIYALRENNMRRLLAYSLVTQIGFMVTGVGIGSEFALLAVAVHAFCHILYKALLLMSAGAVMQATGTTQLEQLGGLYRPMRFTAVCAIIGALAIASMPPTLSFISKPMIIDAAHKAELSILWWLLLIASGATVLHTWLFVWRVFFGAAKHRQVMKLPVVMPVTLGLLTLVCIAPWVFPQLVYSLLPHVPAYHPHELSHYLKHLVLFAGVSLLFFAVLRFMPLRQGRSIDLDVWYRVWLYALFVWLEQQRKVMHEAIEATVAEQLKFVRRSLYHAYGTRLGVSRSQGIGVTALWIGILLGTYLLLT